jgi:ADP-heptose:LPS heptosyltransferase
MKLPGKNIPIELILEFIKYTQKRYPTKYFIFGHPSEIEYFNILKYNVDKITNTKILVPIFKNDIWTAINAISICDMILSADSAVKSASCILKIPTIVLLGDYEDKIRDDKFITPYETDGVLHTIKFLTLEKNTNGILSRIYQKTGELLKK